jgi:radical SAM protein (TIGR01212 family)
MMLNRYHDLNTYFKHLFGERVHKITVDAGLNCPNRDGSLSTDGCIYCNAKGSGTGNFHMGLSIREQIENGMKAVYKRYKAKKFIAYFQSFTNTYGPAHQLKRIYEEALAFDDIIGLSIGTRPDCVNDPVLSLLEEYARDYLVWIEYGLQSAHDKTLKRINRGHDVDCFRKAVEATRNRGIRICAHVILGLPGETRKDMLDTAKFIGDLNIDGVKLHLLYVIKNTALDSVYQSGGYTCLEQNEYINIVCDFLERLPSEMVIQRVTADPHPKELVAPLWSLEKIKTLSSIKEGLKERDSWQGKFYHKGPL